MVIKLRVTQFDKFFIGRINNPNAAGLMCDYTHLAVEIPEFNGNYCSLGLPNFISSYFYDPELYPPKPYFVMPNVFTPNDDGFNDRLIPMTYLNIQSFRMIIFNRWGNKIFETSDAASGWDGGDSPQGVYYYKAVYTGVNGEPGRVKGTVQLLR